jgi:hypothetical protein
VSYTVELIVGCLPESESGAWAQIEELRESYYGDERDKTPELLELHKALTARYPCLCSFEDNDPRIDESPWADGPMLNNFAHDMGMLAISSSRAEEVVPFVIAEANKLGITVADSQTANIHRPRK